MARVSIGPGGKYCHRKISENFVYVNRIKNISQFYHDFAGHKPTSLPIKHTDTMIYVHFQFLVLTMFRNAYFPVISSSYVMFTTSIGSNL